MRYGLVRTIQGVRVVRIKLDRTGPNSKSRTEVDTLMKHELVGVCPITIQGVAVLKINRSPSRTRSLTGQ